MSAQIYNLQPISHKEVDLDMNPEGELDIKGVEYEEKSFCFSDFAEPSFPNKNQLFGQLESIIKQNGTILKALSFYKLKEGLKSRQLTLTPNSHDWSIKESEQIQLQANNPATGVLGLQSRVSLQQRLSKKVGSTNVLMKDNFVLRKENQKLVKLVSTLQIDVKEATDRQHKEVAKKQLSLMGIMQELGQKNQEIQELKSSVRSLQAKFKTKEKGMLYMLEEDAQSLRRTILRLESANQKLNMDIVKSKNLIESLEEQLHYYEEKCQNMGEQIKNLKETNFDMQANKETVEMMRKQAQVVGKRFTGKIQTVRKLQKRLSLIVKAKDLFGEQDGEFKCEGESDLKTKIELQSTVTMMKRTSSLKEQGGQNKLQAVFDFLFNIADEDHELGYSSLFDQEQKQMLFNHRQMFNKNKIMHCLERNPLDDNSGFFDHSLDEILSNKGVVADQRDKQRIQSLENQCQNLISKVYGLKERQLHIRGVILSLLRVLELRSLKKEAEDVLLLVCQIFEYSECERQLIFAQKSRKLFGLL